MPSFFLPFLPSSITSPYLGSTRTHRGMFCGGLGCLKGVGGAPATQGEDEAANQRCIIFTLSCQRAYHPWVATQKVANI